MFNRVQRVLTKMFLKPINLRFRRIVQLKSMTGKCKYENVDNFKNLTESRNQKLSKNT